MGFREVEIIKKKLSSLEILKDSYGKYDFIEIYDEDIPGRKLNFAVFEDKSYLSLVEAGTEDRLYTNIAEDCYGLARKYINTIHGNLKQDIIDISKKIKLYTYQKIAEFKLYAVNHMVSPQEYIDVVSFEMIQRCIDLHMANKGLGSNNSSLERKKEIERLKKINPEGWSNCFKGNDMKQLFLNKSKIETVYNLLRKNYIPGLKKYKNKN